MAIERIRVLGLGKVGELVALLLGEAGFEVAGGDLRPRPEMGFAVDAFDVSDPDALRRGLDGFDGRRTGARWRVDRRRTQARPAGAVVVAGAR